MELLEEKKHESHHCRQYGRNQWCESELRSNHSDNRRYVIGLEVCLNLYDVKPKMT